MFIEPMKGDEPYLALAPGNTPMEGGRFPPGGIPEPEVYSILFGDTMIELLHKIKARREYLERLRDQLIEKREHLISGVYRKLQVDPTVLRNENIRLEVKREKYYYLRYWDGDVYRSKYVPRDLVGIIEELIEVKKLIEIIENELERVDSALQKIKSDLELLLWGLNNTIEIIEK